MYAIAATAPVLDLDPARLVNALVAAVERVLSHLSVTLRAAVLAELSAWREWSAGLVPAGALRDSAARVRHALFQDAVLRRGSLDLAASSVAVAAQAAETASRVEETEEPARRRELLWSARLATERATGAAKLASRG